MSEEKQVEKSHYNFLKYCDQDRWNSYYHQITNTLNLPVNSVLEVGAGDGVFKYVIENEGKTHTSLDIAEDLNPDILGSVTDIPLEDDSYDMTCAFEVLEHLPFEKFQVALGELRRVSKKHVMISLPHWGRHFSISARLPFLKKIRFQFKFSFFPMRHVFDGQHYWEIGKKGYPLKKIKRAIKESGLHIIDDYMVFESPYHHFFILEKKT